MSWSFEREAIDKGIHFLVSTNTFAWFRIVMVYLQDLLLVIMVIMITLIR